VIDFSLLSGVSPRYGHGDFQTSARNEQKNKKTNLVFDGCIGAEIQKHPSGLYAIPGCNM